MTHEKLKLLTREDVCDMLQVSKSQLRRMEKAGLIPRIKLSFQNIRYKPDDIENFIESRRSERSLY